MKARSQAGAVSRRKASLEEAVYLEILRTSEALSHPVAQLLKGEELSPAQYNVLRILRGAPKGLICGEIGNRLVTRDPDITRLLDRLEKRELIARYRDGEDRRMVLTRIQAKGLALLARLDEPVRGLHRRLLGHLGAERLRTLAGLLEACRSGLG